MVGVGGTGWLLGPFVGEGVFRAVYRREWGLMSVVCFVPLFQSLFPSSDGAWEGSNVMIMIEVNIYAKIYGV